MKPKILYHPDEHSNLTAMFLEPIWREYFDIEPIDPKKSYDPKTHAIWVKHLRQQDWYLPWQESGYKIIIDHFWDSATNFLPSRIDNILTMRMLNWSWYNESLWYQYLGYQDYRRSSKRKYFFLMLMRKVLPHRDQIEQIMRPILTDSLYSYIHRGKIIDGDLDDSDPRHQRYFDPSWYNTTQFSMVVESVIDISNYVSEKTFKPFAFQHAFLVWGVPNSLKYVKSLGFETFDHVVDESYDSIPDHNERLDKIFQEVNKLYQNFQNQQDLFIDKESLRKIEHNFHHFYHPSVRDWFIRDAIEPILEFLES